MPKPPANDDQPDPKADEDRAYFEFYLMGRDEATDDFEELDLQAQLKDAVARTISGASVRDLAWTIGRDFVSAELEASGKSVEWRKSSRRLRRDIDAAGGDISRAYTLYCAGYRDELATSAENEILNMISHDEDDDADDDAGDDDDVADDGPIARGPIGMGRMPPGDD